MRYMWCHNWLLIVYSSVGLTSKFNSSSVVLSTSAGAPAEVDKTTLDELNLEVKPTEE